MERRPVEDERAPDVVVVVAAAGKNGGGGGGVGCVVAVVVDRYFAFFCTTRSVDGCAAAAAERGAPSKLRLRVSRRPQPPDCRRRFCLRWKPRPRPLPTFHRYRRLPRRRC